MGEKSRRWLVSILDGDARGVKRVSGANACVKDGVLEIANVMWLIYHAQNYVFVQDNASKKNRVTINYSS